MSRSLRSVIAIVAAATCGVVVVQAQKNLPALDAEIETTYTISVGNHITHGHFYRSQDGKTREDSPVGSTITDNKHRTVTLLNPATKQARGYNIGDQPQGSKPASPKHFKQS